MRARSDFATTSGHQDRQRHATQIGGPRRSRTFEGPNFQKSFLQKNLTALKVGITGSGVARNGGLPAVAHPSTSRLVPSAAILGATPPPDDVAA